LGLVCNPDDGGERLLHHVICIGKRYDSLVGKGSLCLHLGRENEMRTRWQERARVDKKRRGLSCLRISDWFVAEENLRAVLRKRAH
jgi:hypothetical protein